MAISESILRPIFQGYEERRLQAERQQQERLKQVYDTVPRIQEIDRELDSFGLQSLRTALQVGENRQLLLQTLRRHNEDLIAEKKSLLSDAGYPSDYLEIRYTCPFCRDTGYAGGERCRCLQQQLIERAYERSNLKNLLSKDNFSFYDLNRYSDIPYENESVSPRENARKIHQAAMDYIWHFSEKSGQNLLLYGTPGTGKTFLCSCIAKELLDHGYTVLYLTAYDLCSVFETGRFRNNRDNQDQNATLRQLLEDCDLLIIDDLGTEFSTALSVSDLFHCVNRRLVQQQSTMISTNLTLNQIAKIYTDRMASRICGNYRLLKFYGADLRLR